MSSEHRTLFIFSADTVNREVLAPFLTGAFSSVYFTSKDKDFAARFLAELESCGVAASYGLCQEGTLGDIAIAVVDCAEKFGMINTLFFGGWKDTGRGVFLDLSECDFLFYCGLLSELYSLCKCAVPYMLGCPDAKILIPCPPSPDGAAQSMYCGAVAAMGENLKSEFSAYGISVELLRSSVN